MTAEIRVERYFHYLCSCGRKTVTEEGTMTCDGCGKTLSVRVRGTNSYYGVVLQSAETEKSQDGSASKQSAPKIGDLVRVGPFKPDGVTPHPHAGIIGQVIDIFNSHAHIAVSGSRYGICVSASCLHGLSRTTVEVGRDSEQIGNGMSRHAHAG